MTIHQPIDSEGRDLKVGDWVRVIAAPLSISGMPAESLDAFSRAIGHTFQIEEFDEFGCLCLDMSAKLSYDTIYIEPYCVRRSRRFKKLSKAFKRRLALLESLDERIMLEVEFEALLRPGTDLQEFGSEVISGGTGGAFSVWPEQRKVSGSIMVEADNPNATAILERVKVEAAKKSGVESIELSDVRQRNGI